MFGDQGPFKAVIDTGSSDTWLVSKDFRCLDTDLQKIDNGKCKLGPGYSASSSFKQDMNLHFAIQYGDGEKLLGAVGTETVHVGSLGVETRVNVVDNAAWNGDSFSSGLLGLGLPANTANYRQVFFSNGIHQYRLLIPIQRYQRKGHFAACHL